MDGSVSESNMGVYSPLLDQIVNQQAQIVAYLDDYRMMIFTTLP